LSYLLPLGFAYLTKNEASMKILVPTDFSENAFHSAVYALSLAKEKPGSLLHLVHVINPVVTDVLVITDVEKEANLSIQKICKELNERCSSCVISVSVKVGETVDELLKEAESINAGFIIIGLQGVGKVKRFLFGSYALSLLHRSTIPLLIVPEIAILASPRRIVFASDYYNSDVEALHQVIPIAKTFGAEIKIVHLFEEKQEAPLEAGLSQLIRSEVLKVIDYPRLVFRIFNSDNVALGIKNFCEVTEADLLILSTPKRNFLERLFHKSITKSLTYDSAIPVLIFHVRKT
jgi:nucleotide-binding universal stress UspA family protein